MLKKQKKKERRRSGKKRASIFLFLVRLLRSSLLRCYEPTRVGVERENKKSGFQKTSSVRLTLANQHDAPSDQRLVQFFLPPDPETNAALMCFRFVCDRLTSVSRDMSWNGCLELCVPAVQQLFCGRRNMKTVRAAFQFLPNCSKVLKWPKWACAVSIPVLLYALDLLFVKFLSCILWFLPRDLWTACKLSLPPREARGHVDRAIIPRMEIACSGWTSLPVSRALAKRDRLVRTIPRGQLRWRSDYCT